ncbi:MAG TPA: cysteine rich repeat-containing protein [Ancylobacter sp.]
MTRLIALTLLLAATVTTASAQQMSRQQLAVVKSACEADIKRVCSGIQPGGGRLLKCMQANPEKISQPCKDTLASVQAAQPQ